MIIINHQTPATQQEAAISYSKLLQYPQPYFVLLTSGAKGILLIWDLKISDALRKKIGS
jgi:hypothetical protein